MRFCPKKEQLSSLQFSTLAFEENNFEMKVEIKVENGFKIHGVKRG